MSQMPKVTARRWAYPSVLQEHGTICSVGQREKQKRSKQVHAFILLFAISGSLAEIKFCSNSPEAVKGS